MEEFFVIWFVMLSFLIGIPYCIVVGGDYVTSDLNENVKRHVEEVVDFFKHVQKRENGKDIKPKFPPGQLVKRGALGCPTLRTNEIMNYLKKRMEEEGIDEYFERARKHFG